MFIQELRRQCQDFATALLDHTRSSYELEVLLNHDPTGPAFEHGDRMHLNRLKLAVKLRQKKVKSINLMFSFLLNMSTITINLATSNVIFSLTLSREKKVPRDTNYRCTIFRRASNRAYHVTLSYHLLKFSTNSTRKSREKRKLINLMNNRDR